MGRPPIGEAAMTSTERSRRRRERLSSATKGAANHTDDRVRTAGFWQMQAALVAENKRLKRELGEAQAAAGVGVDAAAAIRKRDREIERLKDQLSRAESRLADAPGEAATLARQLKAARTRVRKLEAETRLAWQLAKASPVNITKSDYRKLRRFCHPDSHKTMDERDRTEVSQIINAIKFNVITQS